MTSVPFVYFPDFYQLIVLLKFSCGELILLIF